MIVQILQPNVRLVVHFQHVTTAQNSNSEADALLRSEPAGIGAMETRARTRRQYWNLPQNQEPLPSPPELSKSEDDWNFNEEVCIELSEGEEDADSVELNEPDISNQEFKDMRLQFATIMLSKNKERQDYLSRYPEL